MDLLINLDPNIKNMKKYLLVIFASVFVSGHFISCTKDEGGGGGASANTDTLRITLSKDTIDANDFDDVTITVRDAAGNDVTAYCSILLNATTITSHYTTSTPGVFTVKAKRGNQPTEIKPLVARSPSPSPFTQKILVEDVTGTWCGFCTRVSHSLETYKATNPNLIVATIHGGADTDPFQFKFYTTYASAMGVAGSYPSAVLNRKEEWDEETSTLNRALQRWAPLGLSISSTESGGMVTGTVKVKFNVTTDRPMKLVIALVENGLIAPQKNYYSPQYGYTPYLYGGVDPINDFEHNGVFRKTATDLFGDAIPVGEQVKGNEYTLPFSMTLSGTTYANSPFNAVASKSGIIAMVVDASEFDNGTYNVQYADLNTVADYD